MKKMFDLKKFIALIGIEDNLMSLFFDKADAKGLNPTFDIYHILNGDEKPTKAEVEIMEKMYLENIVGTPYEKNYANADKEFTIRLAEKNKRRRGVA